MRSLVLFVPAVAVVVVRKDLEQSAGVSVLVNAEGSGQPTYDALDLDALMRAQASQIVVPAEAKETLGKQIAAQRKAKQNKLAEETGLNDMMEAYLEDFEDEAAVYTAPPVDPSKLLLAFDFDCTLTTEHAWKTFAGLAGCEEAADVDAFVDFARHHDKGELVQDTCNGGFKDYVLRFVEFLAAYEGDPHDRGAAAQALAKLIKADDPRRAKYKADDDLEAYMLEMVHALPQSILRAYFFEGSGERLSALTELLTELAAARSQFGILTAGYRSVARALLAKCVPEWESHFPGAFLADASADTQTTGLMGRVNAAPGLQEAFAGRNTGVSNEDVKLKRLENFFRPGQRGPLYKHAERALLIDDGNERHIKRHGMPGDTRGQRAFMVDVGLAYEGKSKEAEGPGLRAQHFAALKQAIAARR